MPTISAHRGQMCVVSVSTEICFCRRISSTSAARASGVSIVDRPACCPRPSPSACGDRVADCGQPLGKTAETEFLEQRAGPRVVAAVRPGRFPGNRQRHVGFKLHQFPAEQGLFAIFLQVFLLGRAADFVHVLENVLQRAVFFQQVAGRLGADQRHAGHVVGRIADQGLVVDHLVRRHAPLAAAETSRSRISFLRML